jgi:hypothetical protein
MAARPYIHNSINDTTVASNVGFAIVTLSILLPAAGASSVCGSRGNPAEWGSVLMCIVDKQTSGTKQNLSGLFEKRTNSSDEGLVISQSLNAGDAFK